MTALLLFAWWLPALGQTDTSISTQMKDSSDASQDIANTQLDQSPETPMPEPTDQNESPIPDAAEKWAEHYDKIITGIRENSVEQEEIDNFFQQIDDAFDELLSQLNATLRVLRVYHPPDDKAVFQKNTVDPDAVTSDQTQPQKPPPSTLQNDVNASPLRTVEQQSSVLATLYKLRIDILPSVSPSLRKTITGTGIEGVKAFKKEIDYFVLMLRVRQHLLPRTGRKTLDNVMSAPIPIILIFFQLTIAFFIFYWWRRWAKKGIPKLRTTVLEIKPRKWIHSWTAKNLWYVNRVRSPVEWALLLYSLLGTIRTARMQIIFDLLWTNARLILITWFVVLIVDAMATRGAAGLRSGNAKLRLRSFWLFASWALLVALGLGIAEDLAGKGTIYAWVWLFSKLIALPVLFLLVLWWRREIYLKLDKIMLPSAFVKKLLEHKKGLAGFFGAAVGAVYLIMNGLRQLLLRMITKFEAGRYIIANLIRIEAIRVSEKEPMEIQGKPISADKRNLLFDDDGGTVESVGQDTLKQMIELVEGGSKGSALIVVEHGGGKSFLLKRLAERQQGRVLSFSCPNGNIDAFNNVFADALGLRTPDPTPEIFSQTLIEKKIDIITVDNIHLLSRPTFGGQQDMDRVADMVRAVEAPVFWFFTLDWAAWQYISRVRDSTLFLSGVIKMPLWSEEEIRALIELRSNHAGIEPDFSELVLPRQFEDVEHETMEDRNRFGYYRILWNASDGNPLVSLYLWADSLRALPGGTIKVTLPQLPESGELDSVSMTVLLTLRVIAQSGIASEEQIIDSLRLQPDEVAAALTLSQNLGWIELVNDKYRLNWSWFRSIMMVLTRQNLLVRKT
ncbi:MAG: ATP-binding protein [Thermodesulfobacteriota bacterium]